MSATDVLDATTTDRPGDDRSRTSPATTAVPERHRRALVVLVALLVVWVGTLTWASYFYWDDYLYLLEGQTRGLSLRYLVWEYPFGSHLSPGHRFGDWFLQSFFPLNFRVAQAIMLACFAGTVVLVHLIAGELLGSARRRWAFLLSGLYGTSIVHVAVVGWWGTALLRLPTALLTLASIWTWLRFRQSGRRWLLAASVGALVLGLSFYVKSLLIPVYLVGLRVLVVAPEARLRDSLRQLTREWREWSAYAVPVAIYLIVFLTGYWQPGTLPSLGDFGSYLGIAWFQSFIPSLAGLHIQSGDVSTAVGLALVGFQIVVIAVVAASVWRSTRAWRAWAFFAGGFGVNALIVAVPLLAGLGPSIGYRLMYHVEATFLFPLAVAGAFGAAASQTRRRPLRLGRPWRPVAAAGLAVAVVAHLALAWGGGRAVTADSPGPANRAYVQTVRADLDRLERAGEVPVIADGSVPEAVVSSYLLWGVSLPYDRYSELFRLIDPSLRFAEPGDAGLRVTDAGHLVAPASPTEPLDGFERPDDPDSLASTPGGNAWEAVVGEWGTEGGRAFAAEPVEGRSLAVVDAGRGDGVIQVRVEEVASGAGLVLRYQDPANYWLVEAAPGYATWTLVKVRDGESQVVDDSGASGTVDGSELSVLLDGDRIDVWVNGQFALSATDAEIASSSMVGLVARGTDAGRARFDDFRVGS